MDATPAPGAPEPVIPPMPVTPPAKRVIPPRPVQAVLVVLVFVALLFAVEGVDTVLGGDLDRYGIWPRTPDEWGGIFWAPLLHAGWDHVTANAGPLFVLALLATSGGVLQFAGVTAIIWLTSGFGTFLIGTPGVHLGASGVVFGYLTFVLVRGLFVRSLPQILIAVVVFLAYGAVLWGVLPDQPGISWEGHLCGAVGGIVAAWLVGRSLRRPGRDGDAAPAAAPTAG